MKLNNRKVTDIEITGESDDIQVMRAIWEDTGEELRDSELDYLADNYPETLYNLWFENQISKAEYLRED